MKYKIGVYVRVSTDEQALRSEGSLETQKHRILGEIDNRNRRDGGFGKVIEIYEDDGYSAVGTRPAYQRLMRDVHSGKINLIFIADYFRLCRHLLDYLTLADRLKKIGARVLSVKDNFDTETAMGQSMIRTLINMAQTERELTAERVAINFHARALRGLRNGGRVLYGFDRIDDDLARLKVNESEAAEIREVFRVYIEQGTLARAVDKLNESGPFRKTKSYKSQDVVKTEKWNRMSLNNVLRNPAYRGMREINRDNKGKDQDTLKEVERYHLVKASWPAIVNEADWNQVQEMLDHAGATARGRLATKTRREYPLTSVFTCEECGRAIMGAAGHGRKSVHRYYVHRKLKGQDITCSMNWIPADDIEPKVFSVMDRILSEEGYLDTLEDRFRSNIETQKADLERQRADLTASLAEIDREIRSTIQVQTRMADPTIDEIYREQLRELAEKKRMESVRLSEIDNRLADLPDPKAARESFRINAQAFKKAFAKSNEATRKRLVASVFERISFSNHGLNLYLNPHIASAEAVQILQKEKSSELRSGDSSLYSKILIFDQQVRKKKTPGPVGLAAWDQGVNTSSVVKIGRPSLEKGHFPSPLTYLVDTIKISEPPRYLDKSFLHAKYVVEGLSAKSLADLLGCSTTTVKARLREFGLTKGGSGNAVHREKLAYGKRIVGNRETSHKGELQVVETIKRMYAEEHLRPRSIASLLDTMKVPTKRRGKKWDHSVVIAILKREGIYKQSRKSPQKEGKA